MKKVEIDGNIFYNMDCIQGARDHVTDNSVDLIITDPPYGIEGDKLHKHYNRKEEFVVDGYVEVPMDEYNSFSRQWIKEAERILKPNGQIFIVSGYTNLFDILDGLRETSLKEINHIIWKYNFGVYTRRKFISSHYHILYFEKPGPGRRTFNLESRFGSTEKENERSLNYLDREDVWIINREYKPGKVKNKNELPHQLLMKMIQYASKEGDIICDPFLGGFSTAIVSHGLNRRFVGFELSSSIFDEKVKEFRNLEKGSLIPDLRRPVVGDLKNQGKPWTDEEKELLLIDFLILRNEGQTKKRSIEELSEKYSRGRFAIDNILRSLSEDIEMKEKIEKKVQRILESGDSQTRIENY